MAGVFGGSYVAGVIALGLTTGTLTLQLIAGAVAVGAGGSLTAGAKTGDYGKITETAKIFVEKIKAARAG